MPMPATTGHSPVTLNPLWPLYGGYATLLFGIALGLLRYYIADYGDPLHCSAMYSAGRWLDWNFRNWQPEGCMAHTYKAADLSPCISARPVVIIGDSIARKLFFQLVHIVDDTLPTSPPDNAQKHANHNFRAKDGTQLSFFWDPFLNSSHISDLTTSPIPADDSMKPALLVLGSGLWYLRYADGSGGLPAWEATMGTILTSLAIDGEDRADEIVVLPVEDAVTSKLSEERAATIHSSDIDAMNSDLLHRVSTLSRNGTATVFVPIVFNKMLDESETEDGLHFSDSVIGAQANMLLNHRCNRHLPQLFPFDTTCCKPYPYLQLINSLVLAVIILAGPVAWLLVRTPESQIRNAPAQYRAGMVISVATAVIFLADRTGFWLKEQKQFDPWTFGFLNLLCLAAGFGTIKRSDKDLGFLNREQTDEWKGWMQIAILIYHYFGASKISGIYNPIRVLVAAYLFMTGYGHTTFYIKKADFGLRRIAQVLVRLNLYTLVLAYTMNTDYLFYYFSPLITVWFCIIYLTMLVGSKFNDRTFFLVLKISLSMALVTWFMHEPSLMQWVFEMLSTIFSIRWSAREWAFRFTLDLWIVYFGMFTALAVIKVREHRILDHPRWPLLVNVGVAGSVLAMLWFFAFELMQESKFTYNAWHPSVSFIPVGAFVILRNATPLLRSMSSRLFAFIGTCSLETFIIQYHLWLAGDTKGILLMVPGTRWRSLNMILTTAIFIFVSHQVAQATGHITALICNPVKETLPTLAPTQPSTSTMRGDNTETPETIALMSEEDAPRKDEEGIVRAAEPDIAVRPTHGRWADRLSEGSSPSTSFGAWSAHWKLGLKGKLFVGFLTMWALNVLWFRPPGA